MRARAVSISHHQHPQSGRGPPRERATLFLSLNRPPDRGLAQEQMISTRNISNSPRRHKRALLLSVRDRARFGELSGEAQDLLASVRYRDTVELTRRRQEIADFLREAEEALILPAVMPAYLAEARAMSARGRIKLLDARGILLLYLVACASRRPAAGDYSWLAAVIAGVDLPDGA